MANSSISKIITTDLDVNENEELFTVKSDSEEFYDCAEKQRNLPEILESNRSNSPEARHENVEDFEIIPFNFDDNWSSQETREDRNMFSSEKKNCPHCEILISAYLFDTHEKECAQTLAALKSSVSFENEDHVFIPCQFCNSPQSVESLETHQNRCASRTRNRNYYDRTTNPILSVQMGASANLGASEDPLIPCQYCEQLQQWTNLDSHQSNCRQNLARAASTSPFTSNAPLETIDHASDPSSNDDNTLIPCQHCETLQRWRDLERHETQCIRNRNVTQLTNDMALAGIRFPENWDLSSMENLSRFFVYPKTNEYDFVEKQFSSTLPTQKIEKIERIQNRRWYRQYDAHRDDFIERYGKSTEEWLFHGCPDSSIDSIVANCFNRSHVRRFLLGQGIYFAKQASVSLQYAQPDRKGLRYMFLARVLVGKTTEGNSGTSICPAGFDTTGGNGVYVVYHDAQAYGEYLITFR